MESTWWAGLLSRKQLAINCSMSGPFFNYLHKRNLKRWALSALNYNSRIHNRNLIHQIKTVTKIFIQKYHVCAKADNETKRYFYPLQPLAPNHGISSRFLLLLLFQHYEHHIIKTKPRITKKVLMFEENLVICATFDRFALDTRVLIADFLIISSAN